MVSPLAFACMVQPLGREWAIVCDQQWHRLLEARHVLSAGARKLLSAFRKLLRAVRPSWQRVARPSYARIQSMTRSARNSTDCGISRPSALAVDKLIANSPRIRAKRLSISDPCFPVAGRSPCLSSIGANRPDTGQVPAIVRTATRTKASPTFDGWRSGQFRGDAIAPRPPSSRRSWSSRSSARTATDRDRALRKTPWPPRRSHAPACPECRYSRPHG